MLRGELAVHEQAYGGGDDDPDGVETRIEELHGAGPELARPVCAGEADVAASEVYHLDDVLGLEKFGLEAGGAAEAVGLGIVSLSR